MSTEELTAEEWAELLREWDTYPPDYIVEQKLLRLYAAALARAEAAEIAKRTEEAATNLAEQRRMASESRLADATALLVQWYEARYVPGKGSRRAERVKATRAFLSATHAQAEEPKRCTPVWGSCGLASGHSGPHDAQAAETGGCILVLPAPEVRTVGKFVAVGAERDTALADYAALLEQNDGQRELMSQYKRDWLKQVNDREEAENKLSTALTRIAELEAARA